MKYKVGDKVRIKSLDWYNENKDNDGIVELSTRDFIPEMVEHCGTVVTIKDVFEDIDDNVVYCMEEEEIVWDWTDEMIEGLVEEEVGLVDNFSSRWVNEFELPDGYQFKDEKGNVINATKIVLEKKKKKYPKTYEECLEVLGFDITRKVKDAPIFDYDDDIIALQKLKNCRNAYWKIAGEEMGLGKPWEPDWNTSEPKYVIACTSNGVEKQWETTYCKGLSFPTEEMRDAFKENFGPDIEICKEFL